MPLKTGPAFVSLRDEQPVRLPKPPRVNEESHARILMPIDIKGGTWAGVNDSGIIVVLLNGGFVKHIPNPPYRKSRGLIARELLAAKNPLATWATIELYEIEPFSLVVLSSDKRLFHLVWDGNEKHLMELDVKQGHIFSSATLYPKDVSDKRAQAFQKWIDAEPAPSEKTIMHLFDSLVDAENGFFINRASGIRTISFSYISHAIEGYTYSYTDFLTNVQSTIEMSARNSVM